MRRLAFMRGSEVKGRLQSPEHWGLKSCAHGIPSIMIKPEPVGRSCDESL